MPQTDLELIREVQSGRVESFRTLVERHKDRAFTLAVRMLRKRSDAEEALQDAFLRAFHALDEFRGEAKFTTWFYRILTNVCLTRLERSRSDTGSFSFQDDGELPEPRSDDLLPDEALEQQEFVEAVTKEIGAMPERYRLVLTLYYMQELSYEEMGSVLGLPSGTVKTHLFRARALLRNAVVAKYYPEAKSI